MIDKQKANHYNSVVIIIQSIFGNSVKENLNKQLLFSFCCLIMVLNGGCSSSSKNVQGRSFAISSLAKNEIDLVTELHEKTVFDALKELATKLYKRNPSEWKKGGYESLELAVEAITADPFPDQEDMNAIESIRLTFEGKYQGDRVKVFIVGLERMILAAYDDRRSFYLHNMLDAQKLYDSARNIELASWLLRTKYNAKNELFLLSTSGSKEINLSFERLFGKMINAQDMIAQVMADRNHRQISYVLQTIITAFIPIL